jgi:alpha-L-fucosidase 2
MKFTGLLSVCYLYFSISLFANQDEIKSNFFTKLPDYNSPSVIWNKTPAENWVDGLPIGNGSLGTIVQGRLNENYIINEETLWAAPINKTRTGAYKYLYRIKELIAEKQYAEAEKIILEQYLGEYIPLNNRPLCTLRLKMHENEGTDFYRQFLDMQNGIASEAYIKNDVSYMREQFSSYVDQVLVFHFSSDTPSSISFELDVKGFTPLNFENKRDFLYFTGEVDKGGTVFFGGFKLISDKGTSEFDGSTIKVKNANSVTILFTVGTNYHGNEALDICLNRLNKIKDKTYTEIKKAHIADHRELYNRVDLNLGFNRQTKNLSTQERVAKVKAGNSDPFLMSQFYQMGRYLIIATSRPGSMPSHLQGLWIKDWNPKYNCAYHINVNIEMNYWPAEVGNLSELHRPLFEYIDRLRPNGRIAARELYNCSGFVLPHNVDGTLETGIFGQPQWGFWQAGAAWICQNLWDDFCFTRDINYLREKGYPIMLEAAEFIYDYLIEDIETGKLIWGPSTSPENSFETPDGKIASVGTGIAMDQEVAWDLFSHCIEAARLLDLNDLLIPKLKKALERLEKPQIGKDGRILEWRIPLKEAFQNHRHVSHLYGVYPGDQYTNENEPELYAAAKKSFEYRVEQSKLLNFTQIPAWSKAYSVLLWARFHDSRNAYEALMRMFEYDDISRNLFCHMGADRVIMDGNGGGAAGIAEMIIQSHKGYIELLPCVPKEWDHGYFRGLRARGGFEINMKWRDYEVQSFEVFALADGPCKIQIPNKINVPANFEGSIEKNEGGWLLSYNAKEGQMYKFIK